MHNVYMNKCGKEKTDFHALDFAENSNETHEVVDSVIARSKRYCLNVRNTKKLTFKNNLIYGCIDLGIMIGKNNLVDL